MPTSVIQQIKKQCHERVLEKPVPPGRHVNCSAVHVTPTAVVLASGSGVGKWDLLLLLDGVQMGLGIWERTLAIIMEVEDMTKPPLGGAAGRSAHVHKDGG